MNNMTPSEFDKYVHNYEDALTASIPSVFVENEYFARYKVDYIARSFVQAKPKAFLDFGCGIGRSLSIIHELFPQTELWGYDVSGQSLEVARLSMPMAHFTHSLDVFSDNKFDIIFAANVFHHILPHERVNALMQCRRLLTKNGRIYLFEHNPLNPITRLVFERCPYDKGAQMLTKKEALAMAKDARLKAIKSNYTLFFPRPFSFFRPLERLLGWLPIGAQYCVEMMKE